MKNKTMKNWGIFFLILIFSVLFVSFLCWLIKSIVNFQGIYLSSDFDLLNSVTYFIGYTDVEAYSGVAKLVKLVLAVLGLIFTAFITSILTMHLIKSNKILKIKNDLTLEKNDSLQPSEPTYTAKPIIQNGWINLFQINVVFLLYKNGEILLESEKKILPFLRKGKKWCPLFDINYNSPLFQFLFYHKNKNLKDDLSLIFYVNYISEYSGEQYHSFREYTRDSFIYSDNEKSELSSFFDQVEATEWIIPLDTYIPIKSDVHNSFINEPHKGHPSNQEVQGMFDVNCQIWAFAMILFKLPFGGNWLFFYDNDCFLEFKIKCTHTTKLSLEIKNEQQQHILNPSDTQFDLVSGTIKFKIKELNPKRTSWKHVLELCFTAFNHKPEQENNKKQDFYYEISDLKMVFPEESK